jgi:acetyltransferase-like isoleucine patch superfamily enzyme
MAFRLRYLLGVRRFVVGVKRWVYRRIFGMDLDPSCTFSLSAKFDLTNPRGIHVGPQTYVAFGAAILTHDFTRGVRRHTRIGGRCFIGCHAIILPGVTIGDGSIVAAGAVVVRDVPPKCIVAGNPAQVVRTDIEVGPYGRRLDADEVQRRETAANDLD